MNQIFFRIYLFVLALMAQSIFANYTAIKDFSDGVLEINTEQIPVKIFASTDYVKFNQLAQQKENMLIIVTESNFEAGDAQRMEYNQSVFNQFIINGFQALNDSFKPENKNLSDVKYLVKIPNKISENDNARLKTKYAIWNPSKGLVFFGKTLHFYSLMFVLAFGLGYVIMSYIFKLDNVHSKYLEPLFTWTLLGTIFGARIGHVVFYQPELFQQDFWSVFLPIQTKPEFRLTGFSGLASHGATIALIFTTLYYSFKIIKKNPFWVYDRIAIVVALGGAFVRLGNFFNSEIIGKPVDEASPFAILFPQMSSEYGVTIPRYPTQLFEAFGYVTLFVILWILYRYTNKKYQQGWLFGLFFIVLWSIRFVVEFFKEPQGDEFISFAGLNTGQVLSLPFILAGAVIMVVSAKFKISEEENGKPE